MSFLSSPMISRRVHSVAMVTKFVKLPTLTDSPRTEWSSSEPTVKGLGAPRPDSRSCTAVIKEVTAKTWGAIFDLRDCTVLELEKSTICESQGDIIAGTDGQDIPSTWDEKFNTSGLEAHTPGTYACLNRNIFTDKSEKPRINRDASPDVCLRRLQRRWFRSA